MKRHETLLTIPAVVFHPRLSTVKGPRRRLHARIVLGAPLESRQTELLYQIHHSEISGFSAEHVDSESSLHKSQLVVI